MSSRNPLWLLKVVLCSLGYYCRALDTPHYDSLPLEKKVPVGTHLMTQGSQMAQQQGSPLWDASEERSPNSLSPPVPSLP